MLGFGVIQSNVCLNLTFAAASLSIVESVWVSAIGRRCDVLTLRARLERDRRRSSGGAQSEMPGTLFHCYVPAGYALLIPDYGQARKSGTARRRLPLGRLPLVEQFTRAVRPGVHQSLVFRSLGGQLGDVTIQIAKLDRAHDR